MDSKGKKKIHLTEEEEVSLDGDDVVKGTKLTQCALSLLSKVLSSRAPNAQALRATMKGAWRTKKEF